MPVKPCLLDVGDGMFSRSAPGQALLLSMMVGFRRMVFPLLFHINFVAVSEYQQAKVDDAMKVIRDGFDNVKVLDELSAGVRVEVLAKAAGAGYGPMDRSSCWLCSAETGPTQFSTECGECHVETCSREVE